MVPVGTISSGGGTADEVFCRLVSREMGSCSSLAEEAESSSDKDLFGFMIPISVVRTSLADRKKRKSGVFSAVPIDQRCLEKRGRCARG